MTYPSTNLVSLTDEDLKDSSKVNAAIKKADLDLLDKINKLSDQINNLSNSLGLTNTGIQNKYYAFYYPSVQAISATTETIINFNNKVLDDNSLVTTGASWKYTCPISGFYLVSWSCFVLASGTITSIDNGFYKNGSKYINAQPAQVVTITPGNYYSPTATAIFSLTQGDTISAYITCNGGIGQIQTSSSPYVSKIEIIKL